MLIRLCVAIALLAPGLVRAPQPPAVDLIVYNATVVTMDGGGRVLPRGAVAISGLDIVAVEPAEAQHGDLGETSPGRFELRSEGE